MADNTELAAGSGGDTLRTEDHGGAGVKTPVSLIDVGGTGGSEAIIGDSGVRMPVEGGAAENAAVSGNPLLVGGRYDSSARTLGNGDVGALALTAQGYAEATIRDAASNNSAEVIGLANTNGLGVAIVDTLGNHMSNFVSPISLSVGTAVGSAQTGVPAIVQRDDALGGLTDPEGDAQVLRVDANGALWVRPNGTVTVDGSGVTQPISGTVTVTNAGTFAVQIDGAALTALQLIDDIVATLGTTAYTETATKGAVVGAVRNDTLAALANADNEIAPLQVNAQGALYTAVAGTVTVAAHAVTNAGTFAVQVDGDALTALNLIDDVVVTFGTTTYAETTSKGNALAAVRNDTLATLANTDNEFAPLQVNSQGALYTEVTTSALPTGAATETTLDAVKTAVELIDNAISGNEMQVDVVAALPAGTNAIGKLAANADVDIGSVTPIPKASGGVSAYRTIDLDETEEEVKSSAGQIYGFFFTNSNASVRYLKVYNNTAAGTTVGTTTPFLTLAIPPDNGGLFIKLEMGIELDTGITIAATTGVADSDTGAPGANEVIGFVLYK